MTSDIGRVTSHWCFVNCNYQRSWWTGWLNSHPIWRGGRGADGVVKIDEDDMSASQNVYDVKY